MTIPDYAKLIGIYDLVLQCKNRKEFDREIKCLAPLANHYGLDEDDLESLAGMCWRNTRVTPFGETLRLPMIDPWMGVNYHSGIGGVRVLILSESFYKDDGEKADNMFTRTLINAIATGQWTHRYYTNLFHLFEGQSKSIFWNSVALYHYVQQSVGIGASIRPTPAMWDDAAKRWPLAVKSLQPTPQAVLVVGKQLAEKLWEYKLAKEINDFPHIAMAEAGWVPALHINHPSRRFDLEKTSKVLKSLFEKARNSLMLTSGQN